MTLRSPVKCVRTKYLTDLKSSGIKTGHRKLGRIYARLVQRRLGRVQNNIAAKKSMKESRGRKWSKDKLKEFASVVADD